MTLTTLHAKLLSFGYSASGVAWNRFCSLWLLKCGFSPRQVGAMKSLSLVGKLVAQPAWAACADSGNPPLVLAASVGLSTLALELLRLGTRSEYLGRDEAKGFVTLLGLSSSSKERSHHAAAAAAVGQDSSSSVDAAVFFHGGGARSLAWRVAWLRLARSAASAASPVADAMVLALARDGGEAWGRQRFWGSASWGLGSVLVGAVIDRCGLEMGLFGCSHLMSLLLLCFLLTKVEPGWHSRLGGGGGGVSPKKRRTSSIDDQDQDQDDDVEAVLLESERGEDDDDHTTSGFGAMTLSMRGPNLTTTSQKKNGPSSRRHRWWPPWSSAAADQDDDDDSSEEDTSATVTTVEKKKKQVSHPTKTKGAAAPHQEDNAIVEAQRPTKKKKRRHCCVAVSRGLAAVRRCAPLRLALLNSVAFGTLVVSVDSILYMQLENELAVSRTLSGLATAASTAATFPVFWSSADIVARHGYWRVIAFSQCVLPLRLVLHACVTKQNVAYLLLPIQLLHGPMFAAWISAAVELVDRLAPADLRASTQSLLTMSYFTLGGCLGHLLWSATFELYGGPTTYLIAAVAATVSVLCFVVSARHHLKADRLRFIQRRDADSTRGDGNTTKKPRRTNGALPVVVVVPGDDDDDVRAARETNKNAVPRRRAPPHARVADLDLPADHDFPANNNTTLNGGSQSKSAPDLPTAAAGVGGGGGGGVA